MALMNCFKCKKQVSEKAAFCPHCGSNEYKNLAVKSKSPYLGQGLVVILIGLGLLVFSNYGFNESSMVTAAKEMKSKILSTSQYSSTEQQLDAANAYFNGRGFLDVIPTIKPNPTKARKFYSYAAKDGNPEAQFKLGYMLENGEGGEKSLTKAHYWYNLSANQGNNYALTNIATLIYNGLGIRPDKFEACKLFRQAAFKGNPTAQLNLGKVCYGNHIMTVSGGTKSENAMLWMIIAQQNGFAGQDNYIDNFATNFSSYELESIQEKAKLCIESKYISCSF